MLYHLRITPANLLRWASWAFESLLELFRIALGDHILGSGSYLKLFDRQLLN